jgi:tetratricopeptide (TPR) repeat protein
MKTFRLGILLLLPLFCFPTVYSESSDLPVDEKSIVEEMNRLLEESGTPSKKDREAASKLLKKGIEAHDRQDYEKAISFYEKALERTPLSAVLYYEMGFSYNYLGIQEMALENVIRALVLDPKTEIFYVMKANILDDMGYEEEALTTYDQLLEIQPESYMGNLNKGISLLRLSRQNEAETHFEKARSIDPSHPSAYLRLSQLAKSRGYSYDEIDFLEEFRKHGSNDARLPAVEKRLEELRSYEINVDPNHPYPEVDLQEKLTRAAWRSTIHREKFPEAHHYYLTMEEERAVYLEIVLPAWKETKTKDPEASFFYYDVLQKAVDNGYFEAFLYYTKPGPFGERGRVWREENSEKVSAFLAWAEQEGIQFSTEDEAGSDFDVAAFLGGVIQTAEDSDQTYVIGDEPTPEEISAFREAEGAAFRKSVNLSGADRVDCKKTLQEFDAAIMGTQSLDKAIQVFRCFLPGSPEWDGTAQRLSRMGMGIRDRSPAVSISIARNESGIDVKAGDAYWLFYAFAKAVWRYEESLRLAFSEMDSYEPTVLEEMLAVASAAHTYLSLRSEEEGEGAEEEDDFEEDPGMESLVKVIEDGLLRGFVLFEILHNRYGMSLKSLPAEDAEQIDRYLRKYFLVEISGPSE